MRYHSITRIVHNRSRACSLPYTDGSKRPTLRRYSAVVGLSVIDRNAVDRRKQDDALPHRKPFSKTAGAFGHRRSENEIVQFGIVGMQDVVFRPLPPLTTSVDVDDFLADFHHRVHVVGVDDGRNAVFLRDTVYQIIYHDGGLRIEARIRLVAKQVARIEHNGPRNGNTLDHTARQFCGKALVGILQPDALQTEIDPLQFFRLGLLRKEIERQFHVLLDGRTVQQRPALKDHADVLADGLAFAESQLREIDLVVPHIAAVGLVQADQRFEQHRFARAAAADDEVRFAGLELDRHVVEHRAPVERFDDMFGAYHISSNWVSIRLKIMMTTELTTTARVDAAPTSNELPLA